MILDLAFIIVLTAWSAALGSRLIAMLDARPANVRDALALAVPLGLGVLALGVLGLGEFGLLSPGPIAVLLAAGAVVGMFGVPRIHLDFSNVFGCTDISHENRRIGLDQSMRVVLGIGVLGGLLTALAPVTDGDALCYHLQVPKVFLAAGSVGFDPDLHETVYPLLTELLYAVALAFRGPVACRLVQWLLGVVFAANVTALARPLLGARAFWAGTIALLVPAVSNGMSAPLNDVALAAFSTAALHAWTRWRDQRSTAAALLAGVLGGFALGVKYPALVWVGLLGLAMPLARPRLRSMRAAAVFGVTAVLIGGCWYLRAYLATGNPVYPFFKHVFGGAGIADVLDPIKRPLAVTPWGLLTALGPMTLDPDRFDSLSHQFGPAFLLFLPGLALFRPPRRLLGLAVLGWTFLTLCLTQRQSMRFVLPALGPLAIAVAWLAAQWAERGGLPDRVLLTFLGLVIGFETVIAAGHARHGLPVLLGMESAESYLERREPTARVGRWIDANLPASARLIGQDHRGYYIPRPYTMELAHRRRTGLATSGEPAGQIIETLQSRGFTHILMCPPVPETAVEFDPTLGRAVSGWLASRSPIYRADLADADGVVRRYAIYALDAPSGLVDTAARIRR